MSNEEKLDHVIAAVPVGDEELTEEELRVEKTALRKIDVCLIPAFGLLYMMSFLDRANIGNANLTGFSSDLGLVNNQYGAAVSVVYATYVTFEPFWAVLMKKISPRYLLTGSTICWASLTVGTAFITNWSQLMGVRVLLGLVEAGIIPCTTLYLTMVYQRHQYMTRQTVVFSFSALSGAFGGLLAFGLQQLNAAGLKGWQWLFLVEGLISFCLVPMAWFWIPNSVVEARWLTSEQKRVWAKRQELNRRIYDSDEQFGWTAIVSALKEPRLYIMAVSHFGIDCILYSLTTFMPTIVAGLGFTTTVQAQLLTVPVYLLGAVSFLILGRLSDRFQMRGPVVLTALVAALIGYALLGSVESTGGRYAGVFIAAIGLYSSTATNVLWCSDNMAGHYKRAFAMGFVQLVGNSSGASIGFIFTAQTAPRYLTGVYFVVGMICMSIVLTLINMYILWKANKAKDVAVSNGAMDDPSLGDKNPHYRYYI